MKKNTVDIETLIKQRLKLQTVQNSLYHGFGIKNSDSIFTSSFKNLFQEWEDGKKKDFLILVGGPLKQNFKLTKKYFSIKEEENII